jgi:hypothetical protein
LKGFRFLDVIMHANNPYFNQEDCRVINTIGTDYRIAIRDDSRIFPIDIDRYILSSNDIIVREDITVGNTVYNENSKWNIVSEEYNNKPNLIKSDNVCNKKENTFIEGVNYFGDNENTNQDDIIDSIREELNNIFDN